MNKLKNSSSSPLIIRSRDTRIISLFLPLEKNPVQIKNLTLDEIPLDTRLRCDNLSSYSPRPEYKVSLVSCKRVFLDYDRWIQAAGRFSTSIFCENVWLRLSTFPRKGCFTWNIGSHQESHKHKQKTDCKTLHMYLNQFYVSFLPMENKGSI